MRRVLQPVVSAAIVIGMASCINNDMVPISPTTPNMQAPSPDVVSSSNSYVVIANNILDGDLADQIRAVGGTVTSELSSIRVVVATSSDPSFMAAASAIPGVRSVVPDYDVQWIDPVEMSNAVEVEGNPPNSGDDDALFDLQWGHDAVDAPEAWDAGYRGAGARVAILDSGIDSTHPDIAPNLNVGLCTSFVPGESFDVQPGSYFNHGTHVAGTVAGADNGIGIIGIAPEAELVAVKVLSEYSGSGAFSWILQGIIYATDIDADIINMSLSGSFRISTYGNAAAEVLVAFTRAVQYANQHGTTVIASAGNAGRDRDHDADYLYVPADAAGVIAVSATAPDGWGADPSTDLDLPASYTNYGRSRIDFAAPGGDGDYVGGNCTVIGINRPCRVFDYVLSASSQSWYWAYGTSMSAPHVAGVAALIVGKSGGSLSPKLVEAALRASADDLGQPGQDPYYGSGRVNALRAVTIGIPGGGGGH